MFGFVGIKQSTTRENLLRAVLENIIFSITSYYFAMKEDPHYHPSKIRIDGGISQNDFICQQIANLTGVDIERAKSCSELTSIGCALLSAYNSGILKNLENAENYYKPDRIFRPEKDVVCKGELAKDYQRYLRIIKKF